MTLFGYQLPLFAIPASVPESYTQFPIPLLYEYCTLHISLKNGTEVEDLGRWKETLTSTGWEMVGGKGVKLEVGGEEYMQYFFRKKKEGKEGKEKKEGNK